MTQQLRYRADKVILLLIFGLLIYIPFFVGIFQTDQQTSNIERRTLNKRPPMPQSIQELIAYPDAFNLYYSDHFGFRERLTDRYFKILKRTGALPSVNNITYGQDGWYFLGSIKPGYTRYDDPMGDAININLFAEKELEEFAKSIMITKDWLAQQGIAYIYVIAPNKHTIYFDKFPSYIKKKNKQSSTDQLVSYLQEHTDVIVIDLREPLLKAKQRQQVYYKSDTHWNHYGANIAQFEIMNRIKMLFPGKIIPFLLDDDQFEITSTIDGDLAKIARIGKISESSPQPLFKNSCDPVTEPPGAKDSDIHSMVCDTQKLNALIFRDSFFTALKPYISRYFKRSTYIGEKTDYHLLVEYIGKEKPDIVIEELVERNFPYVPPSELFEINQ